MKSENTHRSRKSQNRRLDGLSALRLLYGEPTRKRPGDQTDLFPAPTPTDDRPQRTDGLR